MAAQIGISRANIESTDGQAWTDVQVVVRGNVAKLFSRASLLVLQPDVVACTSTGRTTWDVTFADGTVWHVDRPAGCGCS